jgi:hypothetical protein
MLVIDDEMDGRTYEAEKTYKSLMSQTEITTRRKYDRRISRIKRRCSFAGSGNNLNVIREHQNRRIIPIEIEKIDFDKLNKMNLIDLFMEAYNLYMTGFKYSYQREDMESLRHLYEDYVQKTDLDMILDEHILPAESKADTNYISILDITIKLSSLYPQFSKWINGVTIGKILTTRGFKSVRKGKTKTTFYMISGASSILMLPKEQELLL